MNNRHVVLLVVLILSMVSLFGSLLLSTITLNAAYFVYGYPVSVVLLIAGLFLKEGVR